MSRRGILAIIRDTVVRHWGLALALVLAAAGRTALLAAQAVPFNADEAIVALMARHILAGHIPLLFYGQAYMGSLDALLVAGGFALFGQQVWVIRAVQLLLWLGTIVIWYRLALLGFGSAKVARWTALLLAVPPVLVTLYTTASLGGYGEALFLGSACLLLAVEIRRAARSGWLRVLLGFCAGLAFWAFPLSAVLSIPALVFSLWPRTPFEASPRQGASFVKAIVVTVAGLLAGAIPWFAAVWQTGPAAFIELGGSAVSGVVTGDFFHVTLIRLLNLVVFGGTVLLGLRPPWAVTLLAPPLLPFALAVAAGAIAFGMAMLRKRNSARGLRLTLAGAAALFTAAFLATAFGNDPSGRYLLPMYPLFAVSCAEFLAEFGGRLKGWFQAAGLVLIGYFAAGNIACAAANPPGLTTQFDPVTRLDMRAMPELMTFLREEGITRGYSDYWVSYPLAFLSGEDLIFVPALPYHRDLRYTPRDDRYPAHDGLVDAALDPAFITAGNPPLDDYLAEAFSARGITYRIRQIGDFRVYYAFSVTIRPEDIGLGTTRPE